MTLEEHRRFYAEEIAAVAGLKSAALADAFASVPRERFFPPGPWRIARADMLTATSSYRTSEDADPRRLYHNILISIDAERNLNNGHPSTLATWIDAVEIAEGDRVFHLGCGTGYYTAIMAKLAGSRGHVEAAEVDENLAARARDNLAPWNNVEVFAGDGGAFDPGPVDVAFINAGVTHPSALWFDRLADGGRLLFPLTFTTGDGAGKGFMILVRRTGANFTASFVGYVMIYSCTSLRDPELNAKILKQISTGKPPALKSLRRDTHEPGDTCWLHGADFCLSSREASESASA